MSERLTRKALLDLLSSPTAESGDIPAHDALEKLAMEGYQYLDEGRSAEESLTRLDQRFEQWLEDKPLKISGDQARRRMISLLQKIAAVILLILVPVFLILKPTPLAQLADRYFEAPRSPYLMVSRGQQTDTESKFNEAFTHYEKGEYAKAASAIGNLVVENPDKPDLKFYQAISLLATGDTEKSIGLLEECAGESQDNLDIRSPWYLALAYLTTRDKDEAQHWLQKTIALDDLHQEKAKELLEKIR
jgi:tetratricopeptide (TPR) repeat protein